MNGDNCSNFIGFCHGIDERSLIHIPKMSFGDNEMVAWCEQFMQEKRCFNNSMLLSVFSDCEVVVGYVFIEKFGISIEHAWNRQSGIDIDMTARLFFPETSSLAYYEMVTLAPEEVVRRYDNKIGVDHHTFRIDPKYKHLFGCRSNTGKLA